MWTDTMDEDAEVQEDALNGAKHPISISDTLLHDIQVCVSSLAAKAPQLIGNFTTNLAEGWMNIRCKFDGGKVINRSQAGSWEFRCLGAGLQQNLGQDWGPGAFSQMTEATINPVYQSASTKLAKKTARDRKRKATTKAKEQRRRSKYSRKDDSLQARKAYSRHDGGDTPDEVTEDVLPETLEELKQSYYDTKVRVTKEEAIAIAHETAEQGNDLWKHERKKRLTASTIGGIIKMRATTKKAKKVEYLLYSKFKGNKATMYGNVMEPVAQDEYVQYQHQHGHPGLKTEHIGLVVSVETPYIAASPDARVNDPTHVPSDGLAEYKNPYSARKKSLDEACKTKTFFLQRKEQNGEVKYILKRRHDYYFQVQCQLYCENREWCDFVVRTEKDISIERIPRDRKWWEEQLQKLEDFYFHALLPELACPRYRQGGIREPNTTQLL